MLNRLASAKLAAILIGVLLFLCVMSFVVPQSSHPDLSQFELWRESSPGLAKVAGALGFDDVFGSPIFFVTMVLLAVNLTACTWQRVLRRSRRRMHVPSAPATDAVHFDVPADAADIAAAMTVGSRLWHTSVSADGPSTFVMLDRDRYGFLGSVIMHAGLLLLIAGGLLSGLTRFDGRMVITEGETLADTRRSYLTVPKTPAIGEAYHPFAVRLDSLRFDYQGQYVLQSYARMTFLDSNGRTEVRESRVNVPARWRNKSFLMIKGGHAVRLSATGPKGDEILPESVIRLGDSVTGGYSDKVELADGRLLTVTTTADAGDSQRAGQQTMRLGDPAVSLALDARSVRNVRPGESVKVGNAVVSVGDVRLWNEFAVREDRGIPVSYAAFGIVLLGTVLRLAFGKKKVACLITPSDKGSDVAVWASTQASVGPIAKVLGRKFGVYAESEG